MSAKKEDGEPGPEVSSAPIELPLSLQKSFSRRDVWSQVLRFFFFLLKIKPKDKLEYKVCMSRKVSRAALIRPKKECSGQSGVPSRGHLICIGFSDRCQ